MNKVVFWDFDGTLVYFTSWRFAVMDVLDELEPGHGIDPEAVRPFLKNGFPWHNPEEPHLHLCTPDAWWQALTPVFTGCYEGVGFSNQRAAELANQVRRHMTMPQRFKLYEDTLPVLATLKENGWRQVIISNHMPELPSIVNALGLAPYFEKCLNSAATGYEKPNPEAYRLALSLAVNPEKTWMVGDNPISDVQGAESNGIPAILVHKTPPDATVRYAPDLTSALRIILEGDSSIAP
jgi:putative hydrolase of the HAD superfamily